jgi:hypothetical protein
METNPEPDPDATVSQTDRDAAVDILKEAAADGRLNLEEFSDRVGGALAATGREQLAAATKGLPSAEIVGTARSVSSIVTFFGDRRQVGRWRLPGRLRVFPIFGDVYLDLRNVLVSTEEVDIVAVTFMGDLCVDVPEGVSVELAGFDLFGDRELRLKPVRRLPGTPRIRVRAYGLFGDIDVRTPGQGEEPPSWWHGFFGRRRRAGRTQHD